MLIQGLKKRFKTLSFSFRLKVLWAFLCMGVGGVAFYFSSKAIYESWSYLNLSKSTPAVIEKWKVHPEPNGCFSICAQYSFKEEGRLHEGQTFFQTEYPNSKAAILAIREWGQEQWLAWYNPKNPQNHSLKRHLPLNLIFRSFISLGILGYFLWMKRKVVQSYIDELDHK